MEQEKFTEQAQVVLAVSQDVVRRYRHSQWDVEHILLALLEQAGGIALLEQEGGTIQDILEELGVNAEAIKKRVEKMIEDFPRSPYEGDQVYASSRVVAFLQRAQEEAERLKDEFISTECLFMAILSGGRDQAASILSEFGISQENTYEVLCKIRAAQRVTDQCAEGKYPDLEKYGYDLTDIALQGKLEAVTGRDSEVNQLIEVLGRKARNSPVLVGDFSVDKFSVVEELARRIAIDNVPSFLQGKKIIALDLGKLVAGAKFRGEFEERVEAVLTAVRQSHGRIIPYFDELWVGVAEGGLDIGSMLKFPLAVGDFQCIAATVPNYLDYFGERGLLARQFKVISIGKTEAAG